ncbi:DNA repair protein [Rothia mucilaginosa]|uniref:DNA repair protein n=1 Tax=Rothia mucilaginosa TaxID=43675 RepID=UPI0026ED32D0|nr:DNA repair protein [Rothia mucilaginosa]
MAQLAIPQSLIGALIDIADLGTLDYFPPTERCAHWSLYDAQRQELLCPCAPAANTTTEKLFEAAAKILYENFPRYIDSPEEIIPYTSRQELVAALRRGDEEPSDEEPSNSTPREEDQNDLQAAEATAESTAETPVAEANEGAVSEDAAVSTTDAPKPAAPEPATPKPVAPKPAPSPALFAARAAQAPAPTPSPAPSVPAEAPVEAPAEATAEKTVPVPTPATVTPAAPKPAAPKPVAPKPAAPTSAAPKPAAPTPGAPSPGMFRKSTLTYRPPRIEEYLEGLRARQQAAEAAEATHTAVANEQAPAEELPVLSQSLPSAPTTPKTSAPKPSAPKPATQPVAAEPTAPRAITAEDRERSYRLRPSLRARLERENISEELVRTILREGAAERLNDWTIRFTHDDYRVDVNTASAEVITVIDEYDAEYNEAAQVSLAHGEYNSLNALELEFSERARTFLKKNPPFVFDLMLQALSNPESVRMAEGWTRIYAAQGLEIAISPDERTVLALAKTPDFHVLHAENLRKAQLEELSNTLAKQAEHQVAQAENITEEEK